jgi:competence protein ComEC
MRRELARRPALLLAGSLILGLCTPLSPLLIAFLAALLWVADGLTSRCAVAASFALGMALAPGKAPHVGETTAFRGEAAVITVPKLGTASQICDVESAGLTFRLRGKTDLVLARGDLLEVSGELRPLQSTVADGDSLSTLSGEIVSEDIRILQRGAQAFRAGVEWRSSFVQYVRSILDQPSSGAVEALCFNVTSGLDAKTYLNLQKTGTIHIISASGLHVFIFAFGLMFLTSFLPIPRGWKLALIGAILLLYAIGAGMRPPVVRSVLMATILGMATMLRREPDILSALGISAFAYLVWRPASVLDIGFQLSFVTVAALGMFVPAAVGRSATAWGRLRHGLREIVMASVVATIASAPLTAYYFGMVSVVSVPANVLIAVALPPITLTSFGAHALSAAAPGLSAGLMLGMVEPLVGWIFCVVELFGNLSFAAVTVPAFSAWWLVPYYGLLLALWRPRARPA